MSQSPREPDERDLSGKDPVDVLRRMLHIGPDDAEQVRADAAKAAKESKDK